MAGEAVRLVDRRKALPVMLAVVLDLKETELVCRLVESDDLERRDGGLVADEQPVAQLRARPAVSGDREDDARGSEVIWIGPEALQRAAERYEAHLQLGAGARLEVVDQRRERIRQ